VRNVFDLEEFNKQNGKKASFRKTVGSYHRRSAGPPEVRKRKQEDTFRTTKRNITRSRGRSGRSGNGNVSPVRDRCPDR
jgi:hypothetical protein